MHLSVEFVIGTNTMKMDSLWLSSMRLSVEFIIGRVKNEYDENGLIVAVVHAFECSADSNFDFCSRPDMTCQI